MSSVRVAVDVGGTFTDIFLMNDDDGTINVHKVPSTPSDPGLAIIDGLRSSGVPFSRIKHFSHGTTVGTNALITREFPRAALITTKGFRDVLEIRDSTKTELWDAYWDMPAPYIKRRDRFELDERVDAKGQVITPLNREELVEIARILRRREIATVAVCLINSYLNPDHEHEVRDVLRAELPDAIITISADVLPEMFEFPRTATTVANAVLAPVVGTYMGQLTARLRDGGYDGNVLVLHSGGGVMTAEAASHHSARLAASGLAGGAVAMRHLSQLCGVKNALGLDIGGTSSDISIMYDGDLRVTQDWSVEPGYPIRFPAIELVTVGAGGGSLAWIDEGGTLRSGPESAKAVPGPACYGRGGSKPTTTDANLILGRLGQVLIGGQMTLDASASVTAIREHLSSALGMSLHETAAAVLRLANVKIADAIRVLSIQKGYDPREFGLVAFGGAGPLHACEVAQELAIPKVIIPPHPGITSAMGCALVDVRHDATRTLIARADEDGFRELLDLSRQARAQVASLLDSEGIDDGNRRYEYFATMRYVGQWRSLNVRLNENYTLEQVLAAFHAEHRREFAYAHEERPVEFFGLRVTGTGILNKPVLPELPAGAGEPEAIGRRKVFFEGHGFVDTPIYDRHLFKAGQAFAGPAIVEQFDSTVVIVPGSHTVVEAHGNLIIDLGV